MSKFSSKAIQSLLLKFSRNRNVKYGIPFIIFIVGGSFGLQKFASLRYEYSRVTAVSREEMEELKKIKEEFGQPVTLESEYEKLKEVDLDNWTNIRGARPWEEQPQQQSNAQAQTQK